MLRANRYRHPWFRALCILGVIGLLVLGATLGWLKWHEDELVLRTAESHPFSYGELPANAERLAIPEPSGSSLAAVILYADPSHDSGFWVLHLHGNAASAFSAHQLRHSSNLRSVGLNVLSFDYRGFGLSPGVASETHMNEDAEAAYQELIRRGIQPRRIILWGHSLGTGLQRVKTRNPILHPWIAPSGGQAEHPRRGHRTRHCAERTLGCRRHG